MSTTSIEAGAAARPRARRSRQDRSATIAFWLFMSPMLIGLLVFTFVPIVWGLLLSFSEARFSITVGDWVGFGNYTDLLGDRIFRETIVTAVIFTAFIVPITFAVSLGLAVLVNSITKGKSFFRTVFFIPTAISYVIAAAVWRMSIFNGVPSGVANMALWEIDQIEPIAWIGTVDPPWHWLVLVTVRLWLQVGFYMIIFIAALQEIPKDLYEAAYVDGARPGWRTFRTITLPLLRNTSVAVIVLNLIAAFQAFDEFYNILGGPAGAGGNSALARMPLVWLYDTAFAGQDYGRGAAGAFILTALILLVTLTQARFLGFGRRDGS